MLKSSVTKGAVSVGRSELCAKEPEFSTTVPIILTARNVFKAYNLDREYRMECTNRIYANLRSGFDSHVAYAYQSAQNWRKSPHEKSPELRVPGLEEGTIWRYSSGFGFVRTTPESIIAGSFYVPNQ